METLIMHPKNEAQLKAFKAMAKALDVSFETSVSPYNEEFVAKIDQSKKEIASGKVTRVKKEELQSFLGL